MLPAVLLLVAPFWDLKGVGVAALAILAVLGLMGASICSWKVCVGTQASVNRKERTS